MDNKTRNATCGAIISIIGLIASLLTCFSFSTGIFSISDILPNLAVPTQVPNYGRPVTATIPPNDNNDVNSQPVLPSNTPTNIQPQASDPVEYDSGNPTVSIVLEDWTGSKNFYIQFLAGGKPIKNGKYVYFPFVDKDIAGGWSVRRLDSGYELDFNGSLNLELEPGDHAVYVNDGSGGLVGGSWGIQVLNTNYYDEMIVFPIVEGKRTRVLVDLAVLEIGLLDVGKNQPIADHGVFMCPQSIDLAGNKIPKDNEKQCMDGRSFTDNIGVASHNLGAGTYIVIIPKSYKYPEKIIYDVVLEPGETKRIIVELK